MVDKGRVWDVIPKATHKPSRIQTLSLRKVNVSTELCLAKQYHENAIIRIVITIEAHNVFSKIFIKLRHLGTSFARGTYQTTQALKYGVDI